jgi:iron complex outermembrane receptor protein
MLNYKCILTFLYIILPFTAMAFPPPAHSLSGTVKDASGSPMYGAVVTIPDLKAGAVADSEGRYIINNLPRGRFLVQVHMLSYSTVTSTVLVEGQTTLNFTLNESVLERDEVVVTGSSLATEQRKSPTPIQSIRLKELQENASSNVIDAITRLPGVTQVSTGPAISKPIIRGLGSNRILTISDGIRQEGQQWGDEHGIEIDDYNVSRIEVLKGPASLAYGSDALAGVINIISDEPAEQKKLSGNLSLNYQSNNGLLAGHAAVGGRRSGLSWNVYGTAKAAHDYRNQYDGYVHNSRFSNTNYGASIGLHRKWGYSRLSITSFNQQVGIAEGDRDSATGRFLSLANNNGVEEEVPTTDEDGRSYAKRVPRQQIGHQKLAWSNSFYLGNSGRIGLTLGYQQNTRREFEDVLQPDEPGLQFLLKTYSYDLKYYFPFFSGWQITAGINGMHQRNNNKGIEFLIPDYTLTDAGVYAIARRDLGKWSLSGGLRYDHRTISSSPLYLDSTGQRTEEQEGGGTIKFASFRRSFSNPTGSIGVAYSLTGRTTLKLNFASGYRAPNIAELSANGVHEGTIRYEYGNNALKAENSLQADLGVEYNADHIHFNAALFYNYISNFIFIRKLTAVDGTDSIPSVGNEEGYPAFVYNQSDAHLYGGELYLDVHPHPLDWLHLENTFSYVRGKSIGGTDSTANLPYIPSARWLIELRVQKRSFNSWLKNGFAKLGLDVNFSQSEIFSAYNTETSTQGYTLLSAGLGFDIHSRKQKTICSIILAGQNLLNTPYQNHLSRLRYAPFNYANGRQGIYNTGRNVSLLLKFPF